MNGSGLTEGQADLLYEKGEFYDDESEGHDTDAGSDPGEEGAFVGEVVAGVSFSGFICHWVA